MKNAESQVFALDNFEGPIDFLLHLIQKNEIDIQTIPLHIITQQFLDDNLNHDKDIDTASEFISNAATLLWLKSKVLLPQEELPIENSEEIEDPHFDIIFQLIDHCHFKQVAHDLAYREERQHSFFQRGCDAITVKKPLGIEHLSLQDLATLFQQVLEKSIPKKEWIFEDKWQVNDKIKWIREQLKLLPKLDFFNIFSQMTIRGELIVTFLAILELMKLGQIRVIKEITENSQHPSILIVGTL